MDDQEAGHTTGPSRASMPPPPGFPPTPSAPAPLPAPSLPPPTAVPPPPPTSAPSSLPPPPPTLLAPPPVPEPVGEQRLSRELRFLPVVEPSVPVIEPRLAEGEDVPWSHSRPGDLPPAAVAPVEPVVLEPQVLRDAVTLVPSRSLRLAVLTCAAVLVARDVVVALAMADLRWRGADASQRLDDVVSVAVDLARAALGLGWLAVTVWSVVAVVNGRRVGGWRVSPVSAAIAWLLPAVVYVNPWFDADGPGAGWLVPLGLVLMPMLHTRSVGHQVGRSVRAATWFGITAVWVWAVGRVGAVTFLTDDPDSQITASLAVSVLAAIAAAGWWATTRTVLATVDQGAIERARPVSDLSPAFALQQAAAVGVDPTAVLRAVRSAETEMSRRGPVRVAPMGGARWVWVGATIATTVIGWRSLFPLLDEWTEALDADPSAPAPDGWAMAVGTAMASLLVASVAYLLWGVFALRTARRLGSRDAAPSRWVIGNLIPIVNLFVPYSALRDGTRTTPGASAAVDRWQATTLFTTVALVVTSILVGANDGGGPDTEESLPMVVGGIVMTLGPIVIYLVTFVSMWQIERGLRRAAAGREDAPPQPTAVSGTGPRPGA